MNKNITDYTQEEIEKLINDAVYTIYGIPIIVLDNGEEWQITDSMEDVHNAVIECFEEEAWTFDPDLLMEATGIDKEVFITLAKMEYEANMAFIKIVEATCGFDKIARLHLKSKNAYYFLDSKGGKCLVLPCGYLAFRYN